MIIAQLYCFVFILLLAFGQSTSFKLISYPGRRYVRIVNHLKNKPLTYHCKFADDDLGLRTLQPNGEWEFSFKPALFKTTNFYCYFFMKTSGLLSMCIQKIIVLNSNVERTIAFGRYKRMDSTYIIHICIQIRRCMIGTNKYYGGEMFTYQKK